ncbi:isochorismate synthase [Intrasporangium chromatireducens Q5-1]|uniref:isochorismate synthase n=1 Tax=Intrasporangium chromatireducens Q5-1 TaxID=584657 RepID=W9GPH3_9MICO|nr:isochorismate synthase [Intrasporangium chromatireducens]EWT05799.1 isochorismate synthase [Intrasporangium chromatireducens Q5-1]
MSTVTVPAAAPTLVVRTVTVDTDEPLLHLLPPGPVEQCASWVRQGEGLVGWGSAVSCETRGPSRFEDAREWWSAVTAGAVVRDEVGTSGSGLICFGSFPFADDSTEPARLVVPEVVVGRRDGRTFVTTITTRPELTPLETPGAAVPPAPPLDVAFADGALSPTAYAGAVAAAVGRITAGEVDKVVLARDLVVTSAEPIDPRWLLRRLADEYDNTWVFAVAGLVGATPELLVRRDQGLVTSRVLAGTIRRTGDDEKDLALAASLARSSKDLEEHEYAVRSVAEALAPHCSSINVPESPFVLHLPNVMHLATDVAAVAANGATALALAAALHPSAAVGGTPTADAVRIIGELERMDRGRYAGPVGWMDAAGDGAWGIALRCGAIDLNDPRQIRIFAGCGIVAGSDPESEVAESVAKLVPMRDALMDA